MGHQESKFNSKSPRPSHLVSGCDVTKRKEYVSIVGLRVTVVLRHAKCLKVMKGTG